MEDPSLTPAAQHWAEGCWWQVVGGTQQRELVVRSHRGKMEPVMAGGVTGTSSCHGWGCGQGGGHQSTRTLGFKANDVQY